jgi:hypothetical protein
MTQKPEDQAIAANPGLLGPKVPLAHRSTQPPMAVNGPGGLIGGFSGFPGSTPGLGGLASSPGSPNGPGEANWVKTSAAASHEYSTGDNAQPLPHHKSQVKNKSENREDNDEEEEPEGQNLQPPTRNVGRPSQKGERISHSHPIPDVALVARLRCLMKGHHPPKEAYASKVDDTDGGQDLPANDEVSPTGAPSPPQNPTAPTGGGGGGDSGGGGGKDDVPKPEDVNLRDAPGAGQSCAACSMFDGQNCSLLQMPVAPTQFCDAFSPSPLMAGIDPGAAMAPAMAAQPLPKTAAMRPSPIGGRAYALLTRRGLMLKTADAANDINSQLEPYKPQIDVKPPSSIGGALGQSAGLGMRSIPMGLFYGGLGGAGMGAFRGNIPEGLGRGVIRGGLTTGSAGLGAGLGANLGRFVGGRTGEAIGALGGAGLGGLGGWMAGGRLLGSPAARKKREKKAFLGAAAAPLMRGLAGLGTRAMASPLGQTAARYGSQLAGGARAVGQGMANVGSQVAASPFGQAATNIGSNIAGGARAVGQGAANLGGQVAGAMPAPVTNAASAVGQFVNRPEMRTALATGAGLGAIGTFADRARQQQEAAAAQGMPQQPIEQPQLQPKVAAAPREINPSAGLFSAGTLGSGPAGMGVFRAMYPAPSPPPPAPPPIIPPVAAARGIPWKRVGAGAGATAGAVGLGLLAHRLMANRNQQVEQPSPYRGRMYEKQAIPMAEGVRNLGVKTLQGLGQRPYARLGLYAAGTGLGALGAYQGVKQMQARRAAQAPSGDVPVLGKSVSSEPGAPAPTPQPGWGEWAGQKMKDLGSNIYNNPMPWALGAGAGLGGAYLLNRWRNRDEDKEAMAKLARQNANNSIAYGAGNALGGMIRSGVGSLFNSMRGSSATPMAGAGTVKASQPAVDTSASGLGLSTAGMGKQAQELGIATPNVMVTGAPNVAPPGPPNTPGPSSSAPFTGAIKAGQPMMVPRPKMPPQSGEETRRSMGPGASMPDKQAAVSDLTSNWADKLKGLPNQAWQHVTSGNNPYYYGTGLGALGLGLGAAGLYGAGAFSPRHFDEQERRRRLAAIVEAEATGKQAMVKSAIPVSALAAAGISPAISGAALGAPLGAALAPPGSRVEGLGRGTISGAATGAGGYAGSLGGAIGGRALANKIIANKGLSPRYGLLGTVGGALLGHLAGSGAGYGLSNAMMGTPSWEAKPPTPPGMTPPVVKAGHYPGCRKSRKHQHKQHTKKQNRVRRKHASVYLPWVLAGIVKRAAAEKCGCGCSSCAACGTKTAAEPQRVKIQRPETRTNQGRFAWRGRGANSLRDDPEYARFGSVKAGELGVRAATLALSLPA